ncbi:MAG: hypothetical protein ACE5HK_01140 [Candidatus Methylomirabilales bacterium]
MSVPRLHRNERGITLLDLILVILLIALALPAMMRLFIEATRDSTLSATVTGAHALASTLLEEIRSKRWDENAGAPSPILGPEVGETRPTYDDVDDFTGLNESPPLDSQGTTMAGFENFRQQVSVCYVANTDLDTCVGGTSNYKRVTATVTTASQRTIELVTVLSNF